MQVPVYSLTGEVVDQVEISDQVFAVPINEGVVHQVMVGQLANARQGTASTKTRSEVQGSSRKLFRQKGTGQARAGSRRSGIRRGGGIIFGPRPRDYHQDTPKKMRQLALKCVLSSKVKDEELKVVQELKLEPKTKYMAQILNALGADSSALVVTAGPEEHVIKAAHNIKGIKTMPANLLNVLDILSHRVLLMTVSAVRRVEELWGEKAVEEVRDASV
ncbi:MAG: 50S ribosomal protein L4 [Dehalococcoidales bacterium]|nr:50S ribosomal protein L4 [Dehalococcoidales bacterium]